MIEETYKMWPQILATMAATITMVSDGIHYSWASPSIPMLEADDSPIKITHTEKEWLELIYLIGGMAGLPFTMISVDKLGRKKSILVAASSNLTAWLIIIFARSGTMLIVGRFFAGMAGDVAYVSVPMYISELAHKNVRGFLALFVYIKTLIGIVICYSVAPFVSINSFGLVGLTFVVCQLVSLPFMPETPYYCLLKKKEDAAERSLKWSRCSQNVDKELAELKAAVERQSSERGRMKDIVLVKSNRKALIIMTMLNASQHFSSNSVIIMNLHTILKDAEGIIDANTAAILFAVIMLISLLISASFVDKFGRKVLLISSCLASGLSLMALAVYLHFKTFNADVLDYNWVPVTSVFLYAFAFRIGLGSVPIIITGELFPTSVKAFGMTLSDAMFVIFGTLSIYMYQVFDAEFGNYVPFYMFALWCIVAAIFTATYVPETKGKTLEQIQYMLKGEKVVDNAIQL